MARLVAAVLQVAGLVLVAAAVWSMWAPAGMLVAGLGVLVVGILIEQRSGGDR